MAGGPGTFVALTSEQSKIFKAINTALGTTNKLLAEQAIHAEAIAQLGGMDASKVKQIKDAWVLELGKIGAVTGQAGGAVRQEVDGTTSYITSQGKVQKRKVTDILQDITKVKNATVELGDQVGQAALETEFVYKNAAKIFGFMGDPKATNYDKINKQAGQYLTTMEALGKELQFTSTEYRINGLALENFTGKGGHGLRKLGEAYTYLANKTTLAMHATRDLGVEGAIDLFKLTKSTEISMEDMRSLVERQFSLTGKASAKMAKEVVAYSQQLSKQSGVSAKLLRENAIDIIKATKNFGNVTADEAIRIGHSLLEIGISFQELNGIVGKMQGFEQAVGVVGDLTTVFGVQLDAMELMRLANEDQGQLLFYLRDAFDAAGMGAENMNLPMKRMLADLLSVGDIEVVERIFSDRAIRSTEDMQRVMKKTGEADLKKAMTDLHADMPLFYSDVQSISKLVKTDLDQVMRVQLGNTLNTASRNLTHFGGKIRTELLETAGLAVKTISDNIGNLANIDPGKLSALAAQVEKLMGAIQSGDAKQIEAVITQLGKLQSAGTISGSTAKDITQNFKDIGIAAMQSGHDLAKQLGVQTNFNEKMKKYSEESIKAMWNLGKGKAEVAKLFQEDPITFSLLVDPAWMPESIPKALQPVIKGAQIFGKAYGKVITGDMEITTSSANLILFKGLQKKQSIYSEFQRKLHAYQKKHGDKGLKDEAIRLRAYTGLSEEQIKVMSNANLSIQLDTMSRQRANIKSSLQRQKTDGAKAFKDLTEASQQRLKAFGFTEKGITEWLAKSGTDGIDALIGGFESRQSAKLFGEVAPTEEAGPPPGSIAAQQQVQTTDRHVSEIQRSTRQMSTNANTLQREMAALKESMAGFVTAVNKSADVIASHKNFNFHVSGELSNLIEKIEASPQTPGTGVKVVTLRPDELAAVKSAANI